MTVEEEDVDDVVSVSLSLLESLSLEVKSNKEFLFLVGFGFTGF
jgi:hypothetical protein